ncbi:hypothetical protein KFK09_028044 [Dendrobium nobile]|uniref:Uncharacterized protein n=1 Tax=Dendrobium nobile TaxID=94219 RepID=A0A8T3A244_DENNO|nr:hypothetical protein KFK09_028044 [Dendrobium nobile]
MDSCDGLEGTLFFLWIRGNPWMFDSWLEWLGARDGNLGEPVRCFSSCKGRGPHFKSLYKLLDLTQLSKC